jgi:hypothetical protein
LTAGFAIALGTYSGGWRIMRTMGKGMADIEPPQGFAVETSSMVAILASAHFGFGLSTTHVVSGAVIGTGLSRTPEQVRWRTARNMGIGWLLTLPAAGLIGAGSAFLAEQGDYAGFVAVLVILVLAALAIKVMAGRHRVSADNVTESAEVRVFGKALEPPATPVTQGALAPVLAPALPASTLPSHPLAATPLALTRLKQPKKRRRNRGAVEPVPPPSLERALPVADNSRPAPSPKQALKSDSPRRPHSPAPVDSTQPANPVTPAQPSSPERPTAPAATAELDPAASLAPGGTDRELAELTELTGLTPSKVGANPGGPS